jgi:putative tryptophan/tyrosine transport system substrate-binding protein
MVDMRRREFLTLVGGTAMPALLGPLAARAQQVDRKRRIGVLSGNANNPDTMSNLREFRRALEALGWSDGRNVELVYYYAGGDPERARELAKELIERAPDPTPPLQPPRFIRPPARCRSYSFQSPILSPADSLPAWHGRAAT